ncbi:MAG TPA: DNA primase [Gaiellaceae bacterium]|jgi:DNA primase|nr:DNA primase [Gaiellaceae bacterium]
MARITEESKRAIVDAADMVAVVSARTQLRKAGARYTGRCPFHEERTPSFSVNPVDKLYYCFGCGAGGDLIKFVRETEQLDFAEALEWLAERFRVPLEYEESSPQVEESRRRRDRLHTVLDQAATFYERHLWEGSAGEPVRSYLESRGLQESTCREFRLGLSPGRGLAEKARQKGFTADELRRAGLTNARGNDYFPSRLMFPLADARGRIVGFQARKLREDDPLRGKYVNSPEGELFHKSAILYGLHLARTSIAKQERAVVVEGNTDVMALRQTGFEPVVASMGTALTEQQLKELQRLTRRVYLCFDSDAAGEAATLRGMELAADRGFEIRIVTLPAGTDPADDPAGFEERLPRAESYVGYRVRLELERAEDRQRGFERVKELLDRFPDSPERQEAWRYANDKLGMTIQIQARASTTHAGTAVSARVIQAGERLERDVLAACYVFPSLHGALEKLAPEHFDSEHNRRLRDALLHGEPDPELAPAIAELDAVAAAEAIDETTARELLLRLRERYLRRRLADADVEQAAELQQKLLEIRDAVAQLA